MPGYLVIEGVSSNKQEGEKKKGKVELSEISYCPIRGRVAVLKPFIDKITITHKIADKELTAAFVESLLQEADKDQGHFKKAAQFKSGAVSYRVNLIVPPGDALPVFGPSGLSTPTTTGPDRWARAAKGIGATTLAINAMTSRRLIDTPKGRHRIGSNQCTGRGQCPLWVISRHLQRTSPCLLWANSGH